MALLTDGCPNDDEALRVFETEILSLASTEGINLPAKLRLAADEISFEVIDILLDRTRVSDPLVSARRARGVSDVVVTPQMKRWHALHALELVYRDGFNNQLNDRYRVKWDEYRDLARAARDQVLRYGIGLVSNPIPRAAPPQLSSIAGLTASNIYYVQGSWVNASLPTAQQEGEASLITAYETVAGSQLVIQLASPPAGVMGWNVFIGLTDKTLALQNSTPLAVTQAFTIPQTGLGSGRAPGDGQAPDTYLTGGLILRRA
jgi:hypothetical protein